MFDLVIIDSQPSGSGSKIYKGMKLRPVVAQTFCAKVGATYWPFALTFVSCPLSEHSDEEMTSSSSQASSISVIVTTALVK